MNILVPNLGSTSLKYKLLSMPDGAVRAQGKLERVADYAAAIAEIDTRGAALEAVAFKAVHAGPRYRGTFVVDAGVLAAMEEYLPAAPVHNALYLSGIRAFRDRLPGLPLVAAFETEFHATLPECAARYGVPADWHDRRGIQRYGFHGASHQYVSERVPELLGVPRPDLRLVSCHLGGSSSMCAIADGRSIDTTMGFSPQSGLESATRHGDLDIFAVLYMMEREGWDRAEVAQQLTRSGGLAGLSGIAGGDVRDLESAVAQGSAAAALALDVFVYQVKKTIGAYAAALGGLDAIAFTGGIGENSPTLRRRSLEGLEYLGVVLDAERNAAGDGDRVVSGATARVAVLALATDEELIVARRAYRVLTQSKPAA
jgi:acetate kinase